MLLIFILILSYGLYIWISFASNTYLLRAFRKAIEKTFSSSPRPVAKGFTKALRKAVQKEDVRSATEVQAKLFARENNSFG